MLGMVDRRAKLEILAASYNIFKDALGVPVQSET
jgi:hypothetical protein